MASDNILQETLGLETSTQENKSNIVFREAKKLTEQKQEKQEKTDEATLVTTGITSHSANEMPPTLFTEVEGKPFLSKLLNLSTNFDDLGKETKAKIKFIDDYFIKQVKRGKFENSASAYKLWWNKMLSTTGVEEYESILSKLATVVDFLKHSTKP